MKLPDKYTYNGEPLVDYAANFIRDMKSWLDARPESMNDGKTVGQLIKEFKEELVN